MAGGGGGGQASGFLKGSERGWMPRRIKQTVGIWAPSMGTCRENPQSVAISLRKQL